MKTNVAESDLFNLFSPKETEGWNEHENDVPYGSQLMTYRAIDS